MCFGSRGFDSSFHGQRLCVSRASLRQHGVRWGFVGSCPQTP